jgi:hypothetical protein
MKGYRAALGIVVGSAVGLFVGLLWLGQDWWWVMLAGSGIGLIVGAALDMHPSTNDQRGP